MLLTLDLPEDLVENLESSAAALDVSIHALTSHLLTTALDAQVHTTLTPAPAVETDPTGELRALVAEIAALPKDSALVEPAKKRMDDSVLQEFLTASDEDPISPEEWDRLWAEFEQQERAIAIADALADAQRDFKD